MSKKIAELNHIATTLALVGTGILLLGAAAFRFKATSIEVKRTR